MNENKHQQTLSSYPYNFIIKRFTQKTLFTQKELIVDRKLLLKKSIYKKNVFNLIIFIYKMDLSAQIIRRQISKKVFTQVINWHCRIWNNSWVGLFSGLNQGYWYVQNMAHAWKTQGWRRDYHNNGQQHVLPSSW